jgi:hypothetical protein
MGLRRRFRLKPSDSSLGGAPTDRAVISAAKAGLPTRLAIRAYFRGPGITCEPRSAGNGGRGVTLGRSSKP